MWLRRALVLVAVAILIDCVALAIDMVLGQRIVDGQEVAEDSLELSSRISSFANLAVPAAVIIGGVGFLCWFHCAYKQMNATDAGRVSPALFWLVPGLNLVRPPQMMIDLTSRARTVWTWWGLWAIGAAVQLALRFISPETQQGWVYWQATAFASNLVLLTALAAALFLIETSSRETT